MPYPIRVLDDILLRIMQRMVGVDDVLGLLVPEFAPENYGLYCNVAVHMQDQLRLLMFQFYIGKGQQNI